MLYKSYLHCIVFCSEFDGLLLDYSRQCATLETMDKLFKLAEVIWTIIILGIQKLWSSNQPFNFQMQAANLKQKIGRMYNGEHVSPLLS